MARALLSNNVSTTLSAAITSTSATTFQVASATGFPAPTGGQYFYCTLLDAALVPEIVKVTGVSGTTVTCVRAQDGTTASTFALGAFVKINLTAAVMAELWNEDSVHNATGKATPVDADELPMVDSAASFGIKKLTWGNLKATLLTWLQSTVFPAPGAIGATTPAAGSFTTLAASSTLSASNFSGSSSGTNTGDNAANSNYASDYRAANFIAGTNYQAPLGNASTSTSGILTSTDWNTFNGKQAALGYTPYNATNPSGYINSSASISGNANGVGSLDPDRTIANQTPQTSAQQVKFQFANASATGTGGNYAGVMTYSPWTGTTASTGDASYQLAFGSTATNGGGVPQLRLRKGIDSTWNAWTDILTSSNYNSYSPTLTGGGASGTWAISVTGNAATVGGFGASQSAGVGSRVVVADASGYINNTYYNGSDEGTSGTAGTVTGVLAKRGDNYYRTTNAASIAAYLSGQSMNIAGSSTSCSGNAATATALNGSATIVSSTIATTSGTAALFTGIPSWAKRVTVNLTGFASTGTSLGLIQLGAGSVQSTGYTGDVAAINSGTGQSAMTGVGHQLLTTAFASFTHTGIITFQNLGGNTWVGMGLSRYATGGAMAMTTSVVTLSGVLDRVNVTTTTGVTLTGGSVSITWE